MDIRKVKKLIELLEESGIAEIEINEGEESVRISRYPTSGPAMPMQQFAAAPVAPAAPVTATTEAEDAGDSCAISGHTVNAPMVGTFYGSPSPDSESFVKVGSRVDEGTVICIIEAMKVMNEIKAETSGTIAKIM